MQQEPVLLIPALYCSPRLFAAQIPALWDFGPITVANHTGSETLTEIAAQILALAPPRFALGGISMGGYIALEIMRQAGQRVTRLALIDTSARADTPEATRGRAESLTTVRDSGFDAYLDQAWQIAVSAHRLDDSDLRALYRKIAWEVGPDRFMRQQKAIGGRPDSRPHLADIACPTTVIVGTLDTATPPHLSEEMAAGIPGARLVTIPDCGHLCPIEQPEATTRALVDWMTAPINP